jgi:hypothetical protein
MKTISILSFVLAAFNLGAQSAARDVACAEPVNYYAEFADLMHDEMIAGVTPAEPRLDFKSFSSKYLNYENHDSSHCPDFGQYERPVCAGLQPAGFHHIRNSETRVLLSFIFIK